ncbi:uncharacterized protein LOC123504892 [Portunus trituberculatus]|uniref:uncharacterized protein LOC123504892 n=1 Tax=Portunus trituberculatus TaxID=210409 RepID=UPI001E1D199D|nr:uncharacterized protein LOC123504892 [Portunus trituberculatus]
METGCPNSVDGGCTAKTGKQIAPFSDAKQLPFPGGVAAAELLKIKGERSCSIIFVIDDSTPFSTIVNVRLLSFCSMVVVVSQDPDFLFTFAEWSLKGRLLVWATKLVVVTRLPLLKVQDLLPVHWTFSMMNTIFLNIKGEAPDEKFYGYTYLPYSEKGPTIETVATWTRKRGLLQRRHTLPFPEKFENFHGATVNVTGFSFMPFWGEEETKTSNGTSVIRYEGSDYRMLTIVAAALNFTIRVLPSKTWAEVTQRVEERVSFIAAVYYIMMTVRAERYDFTHAYEFSYFSFAMAKPSQEPQWQSLYYPLAYQVNYIERKACGGLIIVAVIQDMSGMFLAQSLPHRLPRTFSSRVLVGTWLLFSLILGLSYRCNLTASLTIPKYPPRPETIPQLVETVDRVTILPYGESHVRYYKNSKSPLFNALADLMDVGPKVQEGLQGALKYK